MNMLHEVSHIAACLRSFEVRSLQAVDTTTKVLVDETQSWRIIIRRELPNFDVENGLWCDSSFRPMIVRCFQMLAQDVLPMKSIIKVTNAKELEQLERCLRKAEEARASHLVRGGRVSHALVGHFDLTREGQASRFAFDANEASLLGGLPAGELIVKMYVNDVGSVVLGAKYRPRGRRHCLGVEAGNCMFTANLMSVDCAAKVSFREGRLSLDGTLREVLPGSLRKSLPQGSGQTESSTLCVLCLTDGSPRGPSQLAAALNMDTRKKRSPTAPSSYRIE
eukprot:TRINITY_DN1661_c0_g1_i7.p1 TRINITY_DN1661_c0_g1~~TRINITY_DN1661_c0_g1_i7.p1  ORF type:complete len:279 (-),score=39.76 TRINITY_DN1661_c0_g1_i7:408-1244(-)